jgi:hypothetical protein
VAVDLASFVTLSPAASQGLPLYPRLVVPDGEGRSSKCCRGGGIVSIGGLTIATFVTLGLVPALYSFVVLDLKLISWKQEEKPAPTVSDVQPAMHGTSSRLG